MHFDRVAGAEIRMIRANLVFCYIFNQCLHPASLLPNQCSCRKRQRNIVYMHLNQSLSTTVNIPYASGKFNMFVKTMIAIVIHSGLRASPETFGLQKTMEYSQANQGGVYMSASALLSCAMQQYPHDLRIITLPAPSCRESRPVLYNEDVPKVRLQKNLQKRSLHCPIRPEADG